MRCENNIFIHKLASHNAETREKRVRNAFHPHRHSSSSSATRASETRTPDTNMSPLYFLIFCAPLAAVAQPRASTDKCPAIAPLSADECPPKEAAMSDCVGFDCRFGARAAFPSIVAAMACSSYAVDATPSSDRARVVDCNSAD